MVWDGRVLKDHPVPVPLGQPPTRPGFECLQGWGTHSFSGQSVPVPHNPRGEESLPSNV